MTDDVAGRRRRAAYRASHRGSKEMDWLLGRFVVAHVDRMDVDLLARLERLIALPDPDLHDMILLPDVTPAGEFADLIAQLRAFHNLDSQA
jgi:antitoxin CptB